MKKYLILILLSVIFVMGAIVTPVFAVPTLQLYIPDATYSEVNPWFPQSEDSWITMSNPFELQVVGASSPSWVKEINSVKLHIALLKNEYLLYKNLLTPFITIEDADSNITELYAGDFSSFGIPEGGPPKGISPHGIYPTYYASVVLPNLLVATAGETVYDYNESFNPANPEGSDSGDIQYYTISYNPLFMFIHFDATGTIYHNGDTMNRFAPYSHDADAAVPEPNTVFLLGSGLLGLAAFGRAKRKRSL